MDGRVLRGRRTREAVVEAFLSLIEKGDPSPSARAIAERAGVSLRSVFQHFSDLEALYLFAGRRELNKLGPLLEPVDPGLPLDQRVDVFVSQRAGALESMAPVAKAARLREPFSSQLRHNRDTIKGRFRECCEATFEPELSSMGASEREDLLQALLATASFSAWYALRDEQNLSCEKAELVLNMIVKGLLQRVLAAGADDNGVCLRTLGATFS